MFPYTMVAQHYRMTECVFSVICPCHKDFNGSVGIMAPGWQGKVVSLETGNILGVNETGEILLKGPSVTQGYNDRPIETSEGVKSGWLHTGDVGYFNENGELFVVDRKKEMIKVNGLQVAPAEIEALLGSDPRVRDLGVVGLSHPIYGESAGVFIVKRDDSLKEEDVRTIINEHLAAHKFLGGVVKFVDEIPKLPSGKIDRRDLRNKQMF